MSWISGSSEVSLWFIDEHPELPWNWITIACRDDLTLEFVFRHWNGTRDMVGLVSCKSFTCLDLLLFEQHYHSCIDVDIQLTHRHPTPEFVALANLENWDSIFRTTDSLEDMIERFGDEITDNARSGILMNPNVTDELVDKYCANCDTVNVMSLSWEYISRLDMKFWDVKSRPDLTIDHVLKNRKLKYAAMLNPNIRLLHIMMHSIDWSHLDLNHNQVVACNPNITLEFILINDLTDSSLERRCFMLTIPIDLWPDYGHYFGCTPDPENWLRCRNLYSAYTRARFFLIPVQIDQRKGTTNAVRSGGPAASSGSGAPVKAQHGLYNNIE